METKPLDGRRKFKGMNYEQRYGAERAKDIKNKIKLTNLKTWSNPEIRFQLAGDKNPMCKIKYPRERFEKYWASMKNKTRAEIIGEDKAKKQYKKLSKSLIEFNKNAPPEFLENRGKKISETKLRLIKEGKLNPLKGQDIRPNRPEKAILNILKQKSISMKYTGDGSFWIEGFNPDFVDSINKKVIELFGDYWHNRPDSIIRDDMRIKIYEKNGYKTLILWEHELQDRHGKKLKDKEEVINKINNFINT